MRHTIKYGAYNPRRYSKPWIARVDFAATPKGEFTWGDFVGDSSSGGILVVDAEEGQIVAYGQKDGRGSNSETVYCQVRDGKLKELKNKAEAYLLATSAN